MAEAFLNRECPDDFIAASAGLEPGTLNRLVVDVMHEVGIDISGNETKSAFNLYKAGRRFSFVITVCDEASAERCPIFPGQARRLHWSFKDPSSLEGTKDERLDGTRRIRDEIKQRVQDWCREVCESS